MAKQLSNEQSKELCLKLLHAETENEVRAPEDADDIE